MAGFAFVSGHTENILTAAYVELSGLGDLAGQTFQGYDGATLWSQGVRPAHAVDMARPPRRSRH